MNVLMIRATVAPEHFAEATAAVRVMFEAIDAHRPDGVRYASLRLVKGTTFVALLALDDPTDNPLMVILEFQSFQSSLRGWLSGPPIVEHFETAGSYRLF